MINGKNKVTSQIENFFPKSKYPIFALSFYNLMPVYYACNKLKDENEMDISIYDIEKHSDMLQFDFIPLNTDYLNNNEHIHINIDCTKEMNSNVKVLGSNSLNEVICDAFEKVNNDEEI